jgi:hypothetical protein
MICESWRAEKVDMGRARIGGEIVVDLEGEGDNIFKDLIFVGRIRPWSLFNMVGLDKGEREKRSFV